MDFSRVLHKERWIRITGEIREILMMDWDPIDVKDETLAADEYDMYIDAIYGLLNDDVPAEAISDHLGKSK
jgi:hypothetical protein